MLDPDLFTFWFPQTRGSTAWYVGRGKKHEAVTDFAYDTRRANLAG